MAVRFWWHRFSRQFASEIKVHDLDEIVVKINGEKGLSGDGGS
jgi:hypothetical protein